MNQVLLQLPARPGAHFPLARPWFSLILVRQHDRNNRLALVPRATQRLEPHQGRGPVSVVVAHMESETGFYPVGVCRSQLFIS
jgi:hypothetical protein